MRGPSRMWVATTVAPAAAAAGEVPRIGEAADVVADHGAGGIRLGGHRGPPGVDRERDVEAVPEGGDGRDHPVELLGLTDRRTGPGLHPAHVEQVGTVVHQPLGPAEQLVEGVGGPLVVEGVGGPVEDAHHQGPVADVEGPVAEGQDGRVHHGDAIRRCHRPAPGSEQAGGQRLAVPGGPWVVGPEGLQQVEELLAGGVVVTDPVEQAVRRSSTSTPSTSTCWAASRASASSSLRLRRLGDAAEQGDGLVRSPCGDQHGGQRRDGPRMVGLELEGPAQRLLRPGPYPLVDQQVGLGRGRASAGPRTRPPPPRAGRR